MNPCKKIGFRNLPSRRRKFRYVNFYLLSLSISASCQSTSKNENLDTILDLNKTCKMSREGDDTKNSAYTQLVNKLKHYARNIT